MRAIVAGAGRLGQQVALALAATKNEVTLIDNDDERVERLRAALPVRVLYADACDPRMLEEAGILAADVLLALTGDDDNNLVAAFLAKRQFRVARVVARVNDPENEWLFTEHWGVDVPVSTSTALLSLIEEATQAADTVALLHLPRAGVTLIETAITERSSAAGRSPGDLALPEGSVVAAVVRDGEPIAPGPEFRFAPGDEVLVVSDTANEETVRAAFQDRSGGRGPEGAAGQGAPAAEREGPGGGAGA